MKIVLGLIKMYIQLLSFISTDRAAKYAFRLFQKTRKYKFKKREVKFYAKANGFSVSTEFGEVPCYELGNTSGPLVFLVHGWESNGASLGGIAYQLEKAGYRVISLDLPAHGHHKATHTNLLECKTALKAVIEKANPSGPFSIIAHSFGSAVTSFALSETDYELDQLIFLTSPNQLEDIFKHFKDLVNLPDKPYQKIIDHVEVLLGEKITNLSVNGKLWDVYYKQLTIIHDTHDKVIPFQYARDIVGDLDNAAIIPLEKAGHYRMLWNDEVYGLIWELMLPGEKAEDQTEDEQESLFE